MKRIFLLFFTVFFYQSLFCQSDTIAPPKEETSLTRAAEWLKKKLSYHEIERYKTGEIYKEYEIELSFDYSTNELLYEVNRKGLRRDDHHKYSIPLKYIDPDRIRVEKNKCCQDSELYYEVDEAEIYLFAYKDRKVIRLSLIDPDGSEYELERKRNMVKLFIPTSVIKNSENLPEKSVKVLELLSSLCSKKTVPAKTEAGQQHDDQTRKEQAGQQDPVQRDYLKEKFIKATVIDMTGLDGCRFLLKLEDGKKLEPINMDALYCKNNLPVWIKYIIPKGTVSICMSGKIVKLTAIEKRE